MGKKSIVVIFALISIFLFVNGVVNFGELGDSGFVYMGALLLGFLLIAMIIWKVVKYLGEEKVFVVFYCVKKKMMIAEIATAAGLILAGIVGRVLVAMQVNQPAPVEKFEHLSAIFPAEKLYENIVSMFKPMATATITEYEMLNVISASLSLVLMYFIVRTMYGMSGAVVAVLITALWPSQIYGVVYDSKKCICTMLFLAVMYFFVMMRKGKKGIVFSIFAGACLGLLAYMQTSMYILLVIFIVSPAIRGDEGKDRTIVENIIKRLPTAIISVGITFLIITVIDTSIAKDLGLPASKITSIDGYAMMSGLNRQYDGCENEVDYQFLMRSYDETKHPKDAQMVCLGNGFLRFEENLVQSINLVLEKAQYVFGGGYDFSVRVDLDESSFAYIEDAYYLMLLLGTGFFAVEVLKRNHRGYTNFVLFLGILTVLAGSVYMIEGTVQMQFGCIMVICSSAMVSLLYRRSLGDETIRTIEELVKLQEEAERKKEQWTSKVKKKMKLNEDGEEVAVESEASEYYFDEEELEDDTQIEEDIQKLLAKLSIDTNQLNNESIKEKRRKKIQEAKEKQKNKSTDDFDALDD